MSNLVLAADLGAGSLRVGAVTARGAVVASAAVPIALEEPRPGWSEIDPEAWWRAFAEASGTVLARLGPRDRIQGICCAGLTRSQILVDAAGRVLRPAMLFRDRRASEEAAALAAALPSDNPAEAITAFHPLARLAWVARHEPAVFAATAHALDPKDFLNLRLSGRIAADAVTASRYDGLRAPRTLSAERRRCLDFLKPDRIAPWGAIGVVTAPAPPFDRLAGVPVFAGAMDSWAAAAGAGAVAPGTAYDVAGTSEAVGLVTAQRIAVPGLVSLVWGEGASQIGGPTQIGADSVAWCHRVFRLGGGLAAAVERAGRRRPETTLPIFLPYLAGERTPVWRDDVGGVFHSIARGHEADDFLWAVLEGAAHAVRDILSIAASGAEEAVEAVRICGGGARSDAWCQLRADVLGRPVLRSAARETGLIGAAMAGWLGIGRHPTLAAAAAGMCRIERRFEPRRDLAEFYDERAALYRRVKAAALALADAAMPAHAAAARELELSA